MSRVEERGNRPWDPSRLVYKRLFWDFKGNWEKGLACPWLGPFTGDYMQHLMLYQWMGPEDNNFRVFEVISVLRENIGAFSRPDLMKEFLEANASGIRGDEKVLEDAMVRDHWEYMPCTFLRRSVFYEPTHLSIRILPPLPARYWEASPPLKAGTSFTPITGYKYNLHLV